MQIKNLLALSLAVIHFTKNFRRIVPRKGGYEKTNRRNRVYQLC